MAQQESDKNRETKNLLDLAKSTTQDLYALLSLPSLATAPSTTDAQPQQIDTQAIKKAYRKAALIHHPDKNPNNASAAAKFDEINKAYEILINPESRHVYDERQRVLLEKAERHRQFEGKRKRMKEELERRESAGRRASSDAFGYAETPVTPAGSSSAAGANGAGAKRKYNGWSPGSGTSDLTPAMSDEKQAELRRLAAEGARRRTEQQEKLRRRRREGMDDTAETNGRDTETTLHENASSNGAPPRSFTFSSPSSTKATVGIKNNETTSSTAGKGSSLFESTMARLREAEKKRQETAAPQEDRQATDTLS